MAVKKIDMIGAAIGAGLKLGGAIFGGISASNAMKKVKKNLQNEQKRNEAWYNRRMNEDSTQRADAQNLLSQTRQAIRERGKQARGMAAVGGSSDEARLASKVADNNMVTNTMSRIAAAGDARKDNIEGQYRKRDQELVQQLNNMEAQRANMVSQAAQGVANAGAGIAGMDFSQSSLLADAAGAKSGLETKGSAALIGDKGKLIQA